MLIRVTNKCTMGCSHCMIDASSPEGEHMRPETFLKALQITRLLYANVVLLTGGEPFEHPNIFDLIAETKKRGFIAVVTSNGLFALDKKKRDRAKATGVPIQITNDPRFYPRDLSLIQHIFEANGWHPENKIRTITPCRRTREAGIEPTKNYPGCFNLRSITRQYDIISAVSSLEMMHQRFCVPSINVDGSIRAGEADTCFKIGTVESTEAELDKALRNITCNKCGLVNKLDAEHLAAIGEK